MPLRQHQYPVQHHRSSSQGRRVQTSASKVKLQSQHQQQQQQQQQQNKSSRQQQLHPQHHQLHQHQPRQQKRVHCTLTGQPLSGNSSSATRLVLGWSKKHTSQVTTIEFDDEDDFDPGFLQFCATCECQMSSSPGKSLYCSEPCRAMDALDHSTGADMILQTSSAASTRPSTPILRPRTPTAPRPQSMIFFEMDGFEMDDIPRDELESSSWALPSKLNRVSTASDFTPLLSHTPSSSFGSSCLLDGARIMRRACNAPSVSPSSSLSLDLVTPVYPVPSSEG